MLMRPHAHTLQEGEVKLVDAAPAEAGALTLPAPPGALPGARRATADEVLLRQQQLPPAGGAGRLAKQLSQPAAAAAVALQQQLGGGRGLLKAPSSLGHQHSSLAGGSAAAPQSAAAVERVAASAVPLAVLGPGSMLGENVLGSGSSSSSEQQVRMRAPHAAADACHEREMHMRSACVLHTAGCRCASACRDGAGSAALPRAAAVGR